MESSLKSRMKPGDYHIVVGRAAQALSVFGFDGKRRWGCEAHCWGQHSDWRLPNGDTPPGHYYAGVIYDTSGEVAYGPWCIDLVDITGNEDDNGRAGISLHGGGSASPAPFAPHQGWYRTHGCIRVQNDDLVKMLEPLVRTAQSSGHKIYVTVGD